MKKHNAIFGMVFAFGFLFLMLGASLSVATNELIGPYDASIPYGSSASFTVTPPSNNNGYQFSWSGSGTYYSNEWSSTFTTDSSLASGSYSADCYIFDIDSFSSSTQSFSWAVYAPATPTPTPTPTTYAVSFSSSAGGSISPSGTQYLTAGSYTGSVYPESGYQIYTVIGSGGVSAYIIQPYGFRYTVSGSGNVYASYSPISYPTPTPTQYPTPTPTNYVTLTSSNSPVQAGTINLNPTQNPQGYVLGTSITLTAMANSGWHFDHWQETSPYPGALYNNPLSFLIDQNYVFAAVYAANPTPTPTPTLTASPTSTPYNPNPTPTPTANPQSGLYMVTVNQFTIQGDHAIISASYSNYRLTFTTQGAFDITGIGDLGAPITQTVNGAAYSTYFYNPGSHDYSMNGLGPNSVVVLTWLVSSSPTLAPPASLPPTTTPSSTPTPIVEGQVSVSMVLMVVGGLMIGSSLVGFTVGNIGKLVKKR